MVNIEIITKRLAFIKQLFQIGLAQSYQPDPLAAFSILSFQDSIEMFLKLLAQHKEIDTSNKQYYFIKHWKDFEGLTLEQSMVRLNDLRVNFKHNGILPSKTDVEECRVHATDFFIQNTIIQFNIEFSNISLLSLVDDGDAKVYLIKAQDALANNDFMECMENVGIAFYILLEQNEYDINPWGESKYYSGNRLLYQSSKAMGIENPHMDRYVNFIRSSIQEIQDVLKTTKIGIDYKKYLKFQILTPFISKSIGGIYRGEIYGKRKWSNENCQYCIDFVINSSIKLQDFNFDINELMDVDIEIKEV